MVSMKDIASRCGVSVATVSKALNGHADIGEATRAKVIQAANELGYTGNSAARSLKTNRSYLIGILFMDLSNSGFTHEYFASTLTNFRLEAERSGYDIVFISSTTKVGASYLQHALSRGVDGVAIICADFFDPMVQELAYSNMPIVTLDHAFNNRTAIMSDNMTGVEELVHHAYEKGHRKIAYIHGNPTAVTERRMMGFYRACEELKLKIPNQYIETCEYHEPISCYEATKRLLALEDRPTCILFSDDYSFIGGLNAINEAGLKVPEDISVIGYDGTDLATVMNPKLTTWQQNTEELGRNAAAELIARIENPRTTLPKYIEVHGELLEGETVKELRND